MPAAAASGLVAGLLAAAAASEPLLVFHGNVAILDDVYLTMLELPEDARPTPQTAREIEEKLTSFLHRSGYDLAVVRARAGRGHVDVDIDEGTLDKVIVLGSDLLTCLRLRLNLSMAGRVYNRPELERRLGEAAKKLDLQTYSYELLPVSGPEQDRPMLVAMSELHPLGIADAPRRYELRVRIGGRDPWGNGISPEIDVTSLEGGALGADVRSSDVGFDGTRLLLHGRLSAGARDRLDGGGGRFALSSADAYGAWFAPPITGALRPLLFARATLLDRQRADLGLNGFHFLSLRGGVLFEEAVSPNLGFAMGGGLERRLLLSLQEASGASPAARLAPRAQTRPFGAVRFALDFDPGRIRRDRGDFLVFDGRLALPGGSDRGAATYLSARFQRVRLIGWDEFWMQGLASFMGGDVLFPEEEPLGGDALRGPFAGTDYTRRLLGAGFEYRWSLWRDVFKLGVFTNAAVYQAIDPLTDRGAGARAAASAGPAVHLLIEDTIAFDASLALGADTMGRTSFGTQLGLHQAF